MEGNVGPSGAEQLGHQALGQPDGLILVTRLIARPALLAVKMRNSAIELRIRRREKVSDELEERSMRPIMSCDEKICNGC